MLPVCLPMPPCSPDPPMHWQMALYRQMANKAEGSDSPEQIYHLQQIWGASWGSFLSPHTEGEKTPHSPPHNSPA